jgi:hypothetical protein
MEYQKFKRRKVETEAKAMIAKGKTKQTVYNELVEIYGLRRPIAELVRFTPYPRKLRLFRPMVIFYALFQLAFLIYAILEFQYAIVVPLLLLYVVIFNRLRLYNWITVFGILAIGSALGQLGIYFTSSPRGELDIALLSVSVVYGIVSIWYGNYIPRKLTPPVNESKEFYIHPSGKKKLRLVHTFRD